MNTAAYYRSSTNLQKDSIETQREMIRMFSIQNGYLIEEEYEEPGISARKNSLKERSELQRLIMNIRKGRVKSLLVYKRDRLARKAHEHMELYYLFKKYQVNVKYVADNEKPTSYDAMGEMMELMVAAMNERDGKQISDRIIDTTIANFESGKTIGKLGVYGYQLSEDKSKILRNEEELELVKKIFNEWNQGYFENVNMFTTWLNDHGYTKSGKNWTKGSVISTLEQPLYYGMHIRNWRNEPRKKQRESLAIITLEEFELANKLLEEKEAKKKIKPVIKEKKILLLDKLTICRECERVALKQSNSIYIRNEMDRQGFLLKTYLKSKNNKDLYTYECRKHKICIEAETVEEEIFREAVDFFREMVSEHYNGLYMRFLKPNLQLIKKEIKEKEREKEILEEAFVDLTSVWINKETKQSLKQLQEIQKQMKVIATKIEDLKSKEYAYSFRKKEVDGIKGILKDLDSLEYNQKRYLVQDVIEEILVNGDLYTIVFKHPFLQKEGEISWKDS